MIEGRKVFVFGEKPVFADSIDVWADWLQQRLDLERRCHYRVLVEQMPLARG